MKIIFYSFGQVYSVQRAALSARSADKASPLTCSAVSTRSWSHRTLEHVSCVVLVNFVDCSSVKAQKSLQFWSYKAEKHHDCSF